ncbi:MAG: hypothetical protein JRD68_16040 [Deltaproteobacteria bacterium]|nr:hypothetical protein [Deltaproteobacteria bacterium]
MKISNASVSLVKWPFTLPVEHSLARNTATENLVVRLTDENGLSGYGEGIPRDYVTGETTPTALEGLKTSLLPLVLDRDFDPNQAFGFLKNNLPIEQIDCWPSAACAVELALLDLAGRIKGVPVSKLIGQPSERELVYTAVIPVTNPKNLEEILSHIHTLQVREIKAKVGLEGDLEFVSFLRETLGPEVKLRVDANGAWTAKTAVRKIKEMEELGITSVEQPVAKDDFEGLAQVKREVQALVFADESACTPEEARRLIEAEAVDGFNLRLSKNGGPARTLDIFYMAQKAGLVCQLGCQVGELGILSAAGRHFASTRPELIHLEGSLTRFFLPQDIIDENLSPRRFGETPLLTKPGLSVTVREPVIADSHLFTLP